MTNMSKFVNRSCKRSVSVLASCRAGISNDLLISAPLGPYILHLHYIVGATVLKSNHSTGLKTLKRSRLHNATIINI